MKGTPILVAGFIAVTTLELAVAEASAFDSSLCIECLSVRVGPPTVVRGPFPDELDAPFTALKLPDGSFRGFSANGATYAIDGPSLEQMDGQRLAVIEGGPDGSISECGRWLTSTVRSGETVIGLLHQERACDYNQGQSDKSMAVANSLDDGLTWDVLGTVITGRDAPQPGQVTGEGDCTMVDGRDNYLYAYCLRNSDWQTIVARAPVSDPTNWRKYYEGGWSQPGLGGQATAIGFFGTGTGYMVQNGWVAAVTTDPWFQGLRLSLSVDNVTFVDLEDPLLPIDGADWDRPADTGLAVYASLINPDDGSANIHPDFLLSYVYVPPGEGFESRYLVQHEVSLSMKDQPPAVQAGVALTRWHDAERNIFITSSGPLTGERNTYRRDALVAYIMTRAPQGAMSVKLEECSSDGPGHLDHALAEDGGCAAEGYVRERTAGWLYAAEQPGTVPVYRCHNEAARTHFASSAPDCENLGTTQSLLGYGLAP